MTLLAIHRENTGVIKFEIKASSWACGCLSNFRLAPYGFPLTREELTAGYAIIRHNVRTFRSAGVIEVAKGKQLAESTLQKLEACQDSSGQHEGWRYFIETTDQKTGNDPVVATERRQKQFEVRKSLAMQETKSSVLPPDTQQ